MKFIIFYLFFGVLLFQHTNSATILSGSENHFKLGIVNGEDAPGNEGTHVVAIFNRGKFYCTGSLIDSTTVVSAAHCVFSENPSDFIIRYGTHLLNSTKYKDVGIKWFKTHPDYDDSSFDISILKLNESVNNADVSFIDLQQTELESTKEAFTLYGFGRIDSNVQDGSRKLQKEITYNATEEEYEKVRKILSHEWLFSWLFSPPKLPPGSLLVRNPNSTPCNGDSGAGLVHRNKLIAVLKGGIYDEQNPELCHRGEINLYSKLPYDWIMQNRG